MSHRQKCATELYWEKIGEFEKDKLTELCDKHKYIFLDEHDYLTCDECYALDRKYSLTLIKPYNLMFQKTLNYYNRPQIRAIFNYNGIRYNFVVTDDNWESKYKSLELGLYEEDSENTFLTISLGECFNKKHYKLVAAVIKTD